MNFPAQLIFNELHFYSLPLQLIVLRRIVSQNSTFHHTKWVSPQVFHRAVNSQTKKVKKDGMPGMSPNMAANSARRVGFGGNVDSIFFYDT